MLTAVRINAARPKARPYKMTDALSLYLYVSLSGGKLWRFNYRFGGKSQTLSFGAYPEISLSDARERRDLARKQLAQGIDPGEVRRAEKIATRPDAFEAVAREWHVKFTHTWTPRYAAEIMERLQRDIFPWMGSRPISEIRAPELLSVLRRIEDRGTLESVRKVKIIVSQIFRYGIATSRAERDPASDLRGAFPRAATKHFAALTDPRDVAALLQNIDGYQGGFVVRCALQFAPLVFVRPGELRHAEWAEIDLNNGIWCIPAVKMKTKNDHIVPLSRQTIAILESLRPLTGNGRYLFPSIRTSRQPISENTINAALRTLGYTKDQVTAHGFRATARTILDEVLNVRPDYIEHQLAHAVRDPNGRAYNRTTHLNERKQMMQLWADYLYGLKAGSSVPLSVWSPDVAP